MDQRSKIAILGFGVEGRAVFDYLLAHNYVDLTICDINTDIKDEMPEGVSVRLGPKYLEQLTDFDVLMRSPGIPFLHPLVQSALAQGVEVTSPTDFFVQTCPCPIIGVTGTKGKGTTSTLIFEMLKRSRNNVFLGGNIGNPAVTFLDELDGESLVVLELSSFQLQDLKKGPKYAVMLNTTSDHLDYHADRDEYWRAKEQLLAHQSENSVVVINKDYDYSKYFAPVAKGAVKFISVKEPVENGAFLQEGMILYVKDEVEEEIAIEGEVALMGAHNLENILPSIVIAKELGVSNEDIRHVIKNFRGLPHRIEPCGEFEGVSFYNDSYSTTPETSIAAVDSFDIPTVLIAGGHDKGADYSEWAAKILSKKSLKKIILIGANREKMKEALVSAGGEKERLGFADTLGEAVKNGFETVKGNGAVVMSPAAASFDMFKNYKERGETFKQLVQELGQ